MRKKQSRLSRKALVLHTQPRKKGKDMDAAGPFSLFHVDGKEYNPLSFTERATADMTAKIWNRRLRQQGKVGVWLVHTRAEREAQAREGVAKKEPAKAKAPETNLDNWDVLVNEADDCLEFRNLTRGTYQAGALHIVPHSNWKYPYALVVRGGHHVLLMQRHVRQILEGFLKLQERVEKVEA